MTLSTIRPEFCTIKNIYIEETENNQHIQEYDILCGIGKRPETGIFRCFGKEKRQSHIRKNSALGEEHAEKALKIVHRLSKTLRLVSNTKEILKDGGRKIIVYKFQSMNDDKYYNGTVW